MFSASLLRRALAICAPLSTLVSLAHAQEGQPRAAASPAPVDTTSVPASNPAPALPAPPPAAPVAPPVPTAVAVPSAPAIVVAPIVAPSKEPDADPPLPNHRAMGFLSRFLDGYTTEYAYVSTLSVPARRSMPDALDSPPFPAAHWSLNGTIDIGIPDTTIYPLMGAIYGSGSVGKAIEKSHIKLYGWSDETLNVSTSTSFRGNYPAAYQLNPNTITLQQAFARLERIPDTVQTDHLDWGFRVDALYGVDYRYTEMNGIFGNQLRNNNLYGFDINEFYLDLYVPWVLDGLDIRVGRYISIPDIEANLTVDQPFSSHSLTYTYDPFSQMGIELSLKIDKNWWAQLGLVAGDDVAVWGDNATPTLNGCIRWESDDQRDSWYPCVNSLSTQSYKPETAGPTPGSSPLPFPSNNLNALSTTWGHRFTKAWTMQTESWFMWIPDAPEFANGSPTGRTIPYNWEWTFLNFQFYQFAPKDFLGWRNEFFDDRFGQRTGFMGAIYETTVSWNHWFANNNVGIRPEVRLDQDSLGRDAVRQRDEEDPGNGADGSRLALLTSHRGAGAAPLEQARAAPSRFRGGLLPWQEPPEVLRLYPELFSA